MWTNSNSMTSRPQKNVRFVSSNYPEKQPCWGTKRSAWTSDEEAPSSTPTHSSMMNAKMSSSSSSSTRRSHSFYQRILFPPKRQELFVYELPECLFIHNEEKISERSEEFDESNDEDRTTTKTTRMERIRNSANCANNAPKLNSILKKSQCDIHQSHQALLSGTPQQLQTTSKSKSKSLFWKNKNKNKNKKKKNAVPITRRVSDINSSEHTDSSSISSSSSICIDKTSTSLSRSHRDSFSDLQKLLVTQRSGLKKGEDSNTTSTSSLSTTDLEYDDTTTEEVATDDCDYRRVVHLEKEILAIIHK